MAGISKNNPDPSKNNLLKWLEIGVPLFSFGGALLAILFQAQGISLDFHIPAFGCVIASCFLAYLAWVRPKKDIVALSTPIYSFLFFIVPTDYSTGILLQLLYAISLTILLIRLKYRFGTPGTAVSLGRELGGSLKTYITQTRDSFKNISPEAAHAAAVVFVRFAEGNYAEAEQSSKTALIKEEITGHTTTLMMAFSIIREHSLLLNKSLPRPVTYQTFSERDVPVLAKPAAPGNDADTEFYNALDNALLVVFSAAWNNSEQDRPYLLACQVFAQRLMVH
jgi:hypothetical protein